MNGHGLTSYKFNAFHIVLLRFNLLENHQTQQTYWRYILGFLILSSYKDEWTWPD